MTYRRALELLEARQETRIRLGLARVRWHLAALGDPQEAFRSIHVAGTNGKGAVCAMLASVLREAGWRVGLYTSPHLSDARERIKIDARPISPDEFARAMERTLRRDRKRELTYFEVLTSIAFQHFQRCRVDVAILETGLGGRLDATNVVQKPMATLVTTIDYDHMLFLGTTLNAIAREKAGIFKRGVPALTAETKPAPLRVFRAHARNIGAPLHVLPGRPSWRVGRIDWKRSRQFLRGPGGRRLILPLLGAPQARNVALVLATVDVLNGMCKKTLSLTTLTPTLPTANMGGWDHARGSTPFRKVSHQGRENIQIPDDAVARGLSKVEWPGRFEVLRRGGRTLIIDGAHNVAAVRQFRATLELSPWRNAPKLFILGVLKDKQHEEIVRILAPYLRQVTATAPPSPRALDAGDLAREVARWAPKARVSVVSNPTEALASWRNGRGQPQAACVCGSFYLAGMARKYFQEEKC